MFGDLGAGGRMAFKIILKKYEGWYKSNATSSFFTENLIPVTMKFTHYYKNLFQFIVICKMAST
jgi:hypothetical protein